MAAAPRTASEASDTEGLDLAAFNRALLESVGVGLAIANADSLAILFHNHRFADLFPLFAANGTIDQLIELPDLSALAPDHVESFEREVKVGRRAVSLVVQVSVHESAGGRCLLVECQNVSKIKELEYMIESYSTMVEKNARQIKREKERAEKLLLNIMPKSVFEELKTFGVTTPQRYEDASVLMLDFVGFTEKANETDATLLITELNDIFTAFDRIAEQFGCERIKTMGDAYMAVSGLPDRTPDHAQNIARAALLFRRYLGQRNAARDDKWECRIGIATGPVIGSIVGIQKYVYDIFGPAVNMASRMEEQSGPMEITMTESFQALIRGDFRVADKGEHEVKGFGTRRLYSLVGGGGDLDILSL